MVTTFSSLMLVLKIMMDLPALETNEQLYINLDGITNKEEI